MNYKSISTRTRIIIIIAVVAAAVAAFGAYQHFHDRGTKEAILYTCPMHPSYISDRPGQCPICGMTLVPVKKTDQEAAPVKAPDAGKKRTAVMIDAEKQSRIGVKTARVEKGDAALTIRASGSVAYDPDLQVAQREYIEARRAGDSNLVAASERRLSLMGMGKDQIAELARSGKPDESLVLPTDKAWVYASIYEKEFPLVKPGQTASIELPDGTRFGEGTVRAIDPVLDQATRSARARIEIKNDASKLRPNMFVTAIIRQDLGERLLVPKSAVLDSGTRKLVFIVHDGVHFVPAEANLGAELSDNYVVEGGLSEGDVVATSALFLIDSESQLKAASESIGGHKHD